MRGHDDWDQGASQVCPFAHYVCVYMHYACMNRASPFPCVHPGTLHHSCPVYLHTACQRRPSSHPPSFPPPIPRPNLISLNAAELTTPTPLNIISVTSSSNSLPPLRARRSPRKTKKGGRQARQLMAHVFVPSLPRGGRKSDYLLVQQRLRTRERQRAAKGKARARDNSGSRDLMQALQSAFEKNWDSTDGPREKTKTTKKPAK